MITSEDGFKNPGKFAHMVEAAKGKKEAVAKEAEIAVAVANAQAKAAPRGLLERVADVFV